MSDQNLPTYFKDYLDEKFKGLEDFIRSIKDDVDKRLDAQDRRIEEQKKQIKSDITCRKEDIDEHKQEIEEAHQRHKDEIDRKIKLAKWIFIIFLLANVFLWIDQSRDIIIEIVSRAI